MVMSSWFYKLAVWIILTLRLKGALFTSLELGVHVGCFMLVGQELKHSYFWNYFEGYRDVYAVIIVLSAMCKT